MTAKLWSRVAVGDVLGDRFEVVAPIGAGGTAAVYACKDRVLRGPAAVKVLTGSSEDARQRFLNESRILANLRSPHLVQVLDVGEINPTTPFMALELLPGRDLGDRLQKEGPLPWREVAELLAQVAGALADMHHLGVIHRDIKPNNIVQVGSTTGRRLVKVIDLGIAKVHDWAVVDTSGATPPPRHQTESGFVVGTPGFYPPEVSYVAADPRHDTFALGVTLYLLCTGRMPNLVDLRPMNEARPGCGAPPELEALVASALAVLPEDRIATADEFQRRLEAIRSAHADDSKPFLFAGCFELIQPLGVGAKGEVFRAYHRDAPCYVALKLLSDKSKNNPEERARFAREARVLKAVSHPALPELVECRTSDEQSQPYIAMTLAAGKPAGEYCIGKNRLPPGEVITTGQCLAGALVALHARGILHRDVHASNVLIDRTSKTTTATLIDAGMAELEDKFYAVVEQRYPTMPEKRVKLGTGGLERLEWTAPEARAGGGWTDRSDVYSLGLLLYRLLTGKRPLVDASGSVRSPREHQPACPPALSAALLTALNQNPDERSDAKMLLEMLDAAAHELAEETAEAVADAVAPAPPPPIPPPGPPASRANRQPRRWARVGMGALAGVVLLILAWRGGADRDDSTAPSQTPRSSGPPTLVASPLPEPPAQPDPKPTPAQVLASATAPKLLPMHDALELVSTELRRCAGLADGLLVVAFKVADGEDHAAVSVDSKSTEAVDRCVRDATVALRFQPEGPQSFTEEYTP